MNKSKYIIIYECKEARTREGKILTMSGDKCYVEKGEWGPSGALLDGVVSKIRNFKDALFFDSEEKANKFMKNFKGHPWYHQCNGKYEVVKMKPIYKQVVDGWEADQPC